MKCNRRLKIGSVQMLQWLIWKILAVRGNYPLFLLYLENLQSIPCLHESILYKLCKPIKRWKHSLIRASAKRVVAWNFNFWSSESSPLLIFIPVLRRRTIQNKTWIPFQHLESAKMGTSEVCLRQNLHSMIQDRCHISVRRIHTNMPK